MESLLRAPVNSAGRSTHSAAQTFLDRGRALGIADSTPSVAETSFITPADFKAAMRQFSASVNVITTMHDGERRGLTATAVCSLCVEPPRILCCINKSAEASPVVHASRIFAINVLQAAQVELAVDFSGRKLGEERFQTGEWSTLSTGAPVLSGALAAFDCRVVEIIDCGTHDIFIGDVVGAVNQEASPLLYGDRNYGTLSRQL